MAYNKSYDRGMDRDSFGWSSPGHDNRLLQRIVSSSHNKKKNEKNRKTERTLGKTERTTSYALSY